MVGREQIKSLTDLKAGHHACFFYQNNYQYRKIIPRFMDKGLKQNEKVIYLAGTARQKDIVNYLKSSDIDAKAFIKKGQLVFVTFKELLKGLKNFKAQTALTSLKPKIKAALKEGYSAVRLISDMTSLADRNVPVKEFIIYEVKISHIPQIKQCLLACAYDMRLFDAGLLLKVFLAHPLVVIGTEIFTNLFYISSYDILCKDPSKVSLKSQIEGLIQQKKIWKALETTHNELHRQESWIKAMIHNLPFDIFLLDREGRCKIQNKVCRERWGDAVGLGPREIPIDERTLKIWEDNNRRAFGGEVVKGDVTVLIKGKRVHFHNIIAPVYEGQKVIGIVGVNIDITSLKETQAALQRQAKNLEHKNIALNEVLGQIEVEKRQVEENVIKNVNDLLLPALHKMAHKSKIANKKYVGILEENLKNINKSLSDKLTGQFYNLTPRELEICMLIKGGLTTKEISQSLCLSPQTVDRHRNNIRSKLNLVKKKANLATFLHKI